MRDLNTLYRGEPALHALDSDPAGFQWIEADDADMSVFAWLRRGRDGDRDVVVICNMTPIERDGYQIGLPAPGTWREALNSDAALYGGGNRGNLGGIMAMQGESHRQPARAQLYLPPLSTLFLVQDPGT